MRFQRMKYSVVLLLALGMLATAGLQAALVKKMDLLEICERSDKIFRGIVTSAVAGTVSVGGGELSTVTYQVKVTEAFQGSFISKGDDRLAEITMLAAIKPTDNGRVRSFSALPDLPQLVVGKEYLLLTTQPSAIGLSTTVGLAQGYLLISGKGKNEVATDGAGNSRAYSDIANEIRSAIDG